MAITSIKGEATIRPRREKYDIHEAFHELLLRSQSPVPKEKQACVKKMDMICIHKHNIGNFRHTVTADIIFKAEFQKEISLMRGNISPEAPHGTEGFLP